MDQSFVILIWVVLSILIASLGEKRKTGYVGSLLLCLLLSPLIGLIITLLTDKKNDIGHKFKEPYESGKKEEFKGNIQAAINFYGDALYHLVNDYKNLKGKEEEDRQKLIKSIENKISELKNKS